MKLKKKKDYLLFAAEYGRFATAGIFSSVGKQGGQRRPQRVRAF
jgi:hypothetical protein